MFGRTANNEVADKKTLIKQNERRGRRALIASALFVFFVYATLSDDHLRTNHIEMPILFACGLLYFIYTYYDTRRFANLCNKSEAYIRAIKRSEHNKVSELATAMKMTETQVQKDLMNMQRLKLIGQVSIDADGEIQLCDSQGRSLVQSAHEKEAQRQALFNQNVDTVCHACGARNIIAPGQNPVCAYCGTNLDRVGN